MGHVTIALSRVAGPFEPQWAEYRLLLDRNSAILLRHFIQVSSALLFYRGRFHRIHAVADDGHLTIDGEPIRSKNGLPLLLLRGAGQEGEPRGVRIDRIDFPPG